MQKIAKFSSFSEEQEQLTTHLIQRLPPKLNGYYHKEQFNFKYAIPSKRVLDSCTWLDYNQTWVNMLIFDIDRPISLEQAINECLDIGYEPTWICKTDNGVHICFTLENIVKYDWTKAIKLARHIKRKLTTLLKADRKGSHRLPGIWRNPLKAKEWYFSGLLYSLDDFKTYILNQDLSVQGKFNKYKVKAKIENRIFTYAKGYRNDFTFRNAMIQSKNKDMCLTDTINLVNDIVLTESLLNSEEQLTRDEIIRIASSVFSYNEQNKNFVSNASVKTKTINRGRMGYEPIAKDGYVTPEVHKQITKQRQKEWINILNKDRDMASRVEHIKKVNELRKSDTERKILNCINGMFKDDYIKPSGKWNIAKICKDTGLHRNTVSKYIATI